MAGSSTGREQGSGLGGDTRSASIEPRFAKLENDLEYAKRDVAELRTDMRDVRDRVIRIDANIAHLPTKAFVFGAFGAVAAFLAAVTLFQSQIQQAIGFAAGGP